MQSNHNNFLQETPNQLRGKLYTGIFIVNLILIVSFAGSIMYWYALSVMGVGDSVDGVWKLVLWSLVAVGAVTELVKKVSLSTFRHKGIWLSATFVSVLTVMGTFSILDANRESTLVKQSDQYRSAQTRQQGALDTASKYGWASGFDLASLESQLQQVVTDRAKRRIRYASYLSQKKALEKKIEAKRAYDSAMSMNSFAGDAMAKGGTGATSSNPLLSNIAAVTGVGAEFLKSVFYLLVTLLLEFAAFFFGGKVEEIRNRLNMTRAQLLDMQNMEVFGISISQVSNGLYQNVLQAENESIEAEKEVKKMRQEREEPAGAIAEKVTEIRASTVLKNDHAKADYSSNSMGFLSDENQPKKVQEIDLNRYENNQPENVPENQPKQVQKTNLNRYAGKANLSLINSGNLAVPMQRNIHQKAEKKEQKKTRKTVTADTGITGKNATRYRALKRAIKQGKVKPNIASIKKFKHGGRGMGTDTARKYLEALKQGV